MKVIVKKFSVNISSWSNQEVAKFLLDVIKPKDNKTKIWRLVEDQINQIKDKLGKVPTMPNSFEDIYQQFKDVKLESGQKNDKDNLSDEDKLKFLRDIIKPKDDNAKIFRLTDDQLNEIKDKLGNAPTMPGSFNDIASQYAKIDSNTSKSNDKIQIGNFDDKWFNSSSNRYVRTTELYFSYDKSDNKINFGKSGRKAKLGSIEKSINSALKSINIPQNFFFFDVITEQYDDGGCYIIFKYELYNAKGDFEAKLGVEEYSKDASVDIQAPNRLEDAGFKFSFKQPKLSSKSDAYKKFYDLIKPFFTELINYDYSKIK